MSPATATKKQDAGYIKGGTFLIEGPGDVFTPEDFSDEHGMIAQTTEELMANEVMPHAEAIEHKDFELQVKLIRKAGELFLLGVEIPEKWGGMGLDKVSAMLVVEKLARLAYFSVTHGGHTGTGIGTQPIVCFGTEEQKKKYLPKLATGELLSSYALTEASSGSDALAAMAPLTADGKHYGLTGEKMWITNAGFADVFIVFSKIDGDKFSCFIVEKGDPLHRQRGEEDRHRGSSTRTVVLNDAKIPADRLLGEVGKGHKVAFNILNMRRFNLGAGVVGGAKACITDAIAYARERHQFNRPIASFGAIQHKLAESAIRAWVADIEEYAVECSIIKVYALAMLDYVVDERVQIYVGYGYSEQYPAEHYYPDSRINRMGSRTLPPRRRWSPGRAPC